VDEFADVLVVGSSLPGLTLGYRLQRMGLKVRILEANLQPPVFSLNQADFLVERGLGDLLATPTVQALLTELDLTDQLVTAGVRPQRFLWSKNRLWPLPDDGLALLTTPLLTPWAKLRCLGEILITPVLNEETVCEFVTRRFGEEVAQVICTPLIQAIYAGDPGQISAEVVLRGLLAQEKSQGSVLRSWLMGTRPVFTPTVSLRQGLQKLLDKLRAQLTNSLFQDQLLQVTPLETGYQVTLAEQSLRVGIIAFTTPAYTTGQLLKPLDPILARKLLSIYYPPLVTVALAYPKATLNHALDGWGHLTPRAQGFNTLGAIWSSSLFPDRAPAGWHLLTCLLGGAMDPQVQDLDEEDLIRLAHGDLQKIFGMRQEPRVLDCFRREHSLPQYCLGHGEKVRQIQGRLAQLPGLYLCGNYLGGPSPTEVIFQATHLATTIQAYWRSQERVTV